MLKACEVYMLHTSHRLYRLRNRDCVTLDPKIKESTQTTNQIKCEWALTHPLSVI